MTLKRRNLFWLGILLFVLVLGASRGYYLYNKPHQSAADAVVAFSITADSLFIQYQRDEHGSDQKYLNKVIVVSGKLAEIQHSGSSEIWILSVQPGNSPGADSTVTSPGGGGINCQLFSPDKTSSKQPQPGDAVTIKGRCTGFLMDVNLADCVPQENTY
jgi:tRNA_anti-like